LAAPIEAAAANAGAATAGADEPLAEILRPLLRKPWKKLRRQVKQLGHDPSDEALHQVRIAAKRLRYAAEAVADIVGPAAKLAAAVADLQSELGVLHDAVVAEDWLRRQAASGPARQALVAGELVTLQRQEQAASREHWTKPWKRVAKRATKGHWLTG
jgi:CHAD domain-containing protein